MIERILGRQITEVNAQTVLNARLFYTHTGWCFAAVVETLGGLKRCIASIQMTTLMKSVKTTCSCEGGSVSLEDGLEASEGCSLAVVGLGETAVSGSELDGGVSLDVLVGNDAVSDDLDRLGSCLMSAAHLDVHLGHGVVHSWRSVFLVHVDLAGTGLVSEHNAKVSDAVLFSWMDFAGGHDLTLHSSHLVLTLHVVPVFGTSEHLITSEHSHFVKLGVRILLTGESSADDKVLSDLKTR